MVAGVRGAAIARTRSPAHIKPATDVDNNSLFMQEFQKETVAMRERKPRGAHGMSMLMRITAKGKHCCGNQPRFGLSD